MKESPKYRTSIFVLFGLLGLAVVGVPATRAQMTETSEPTLPSG